MYQRKTPEPCGSGVLLFYAASRYEAACCPEAESALLTRVFTDLIQIVSDASNRLDRFFVRAVADVDEPDLVVFAVEPSRDRFVLILKPVRADDPGVAQRAFDIILIRLSARVLVLTGTQPRVEESAVERAEVEFADDDRLVGRAFDRFEIGDGAFVEVVAYDVAILLPGGACEIVIPCEPAPEIELFRS